MHEENPHPISNENLFFIFPFAISMFIFTSTYRPPLLPFLGGEERKGLTRLLSAPSSQVKSIRYGTLHSVPYCKQAQSILSMNVQVTGLDVPDALISLISLSYPVLPVCLPLTINDQRSTINHQPSYIYMYLQYSTVLYEVVKIDKKTQG